MTCLPQCIPGAIPSCRCNGDDFAVSFIAQIRWAELASYWPSYGIVTVTGVPKREKRFNTVARTYSSTTCGRSSSWKVIVSPLSGPVSLSGRS